MTNQEIKQKLDLLGVEYNPKGNKTYLEALLETNSSEAIQNIQSEEIVAEIEEKGPYIASYIGKGGRVIVLGEYPDVKSAQKALNRVGASITSIKLK